MSQYEQNSSAGFDIYTMPLTEVSLEYDTEGLEHRLQHALGRISLQDNELVQASIKLGLDLHRLDRRTYEPYNNHLLRVALRLIEEFEIDDPLTIAAAPLHDSVEDHSNELARRFLDVEVPEDKHIARALGYKGLRVFAAQYDAPEVADVVLAVSNPLLDPDEDKNASYREHVGQLMLNGPSEPRILKISDIFDNIHAHGKLEDPDKRRKLDRKQRPIYPLVEAGLTHPKGNIDNDVRIRALIVLADRRGAAIIRLEQDSRRETA